MLHIAKFNICDVNFVTSVMDSVFRCYSNSF